MYSQALWQGGQYFFNIARAIFFNIARTLCDQSFPRIALCPAHLSYCCYVPQAFAFVRWQNELVRWHTKLCMNNNNNIGWLFFGGYKNILPSMLTILPSSSTQAILLTSLAIYSCIPLKAIQYYINILLSRGSNVRCYSSPRTTKTT